MSLSEDRLALARFYLAQASMRVGVDGKPMNPLTFQQLWLNGNSDRSVVTRYDGDRGALYSMLRIVAEQSNPYDAIKPRLLCYDYDAMAKDGVADINVLLGRTRYRWDSAFLIALNAWLVDPDEVDPAKQVWFSNQHTATHVVDGDDPTFKPQAMDGYNGCFFVWADTLKPASYWDMVSCRGDLTTTFTQVSWSGLDDSTDRGGAIGVGWRKGWTAPLLELVRQGFYDCVTADFRPEGRAFWASGLRTQLDRMCTPFTDGRPPQLAVDMLRDVFRGSLSLA